MRELPGREVHRDDRLTPGQPLGPLGDLAADLADDPVADVDDQARILGDVDEQNRRQHAVAGAIPANQRLGTDHRSGRHLDDRLVEQEQLVGRDRFGESRLHLVAGGQLPAQFGVEHRDLVSAGVMSCVDGRLGVGDDVGGIEGVVDVDHDQTDRRGDRDRLVLVDLDRGNHRLTKFFGDGERLRLVASSRAHDQELVRADATHRVPHAENRSEPLGGLGEDGVTDHRPATIVDRLESIEIDEDDRQNPVRLVDSGVQARPFRQIDQLGETVRHQIPVRQTGQRIVQGTQGEVGFAAAPVHRNRRQSSHRREQLPLAGIRFGPDVVGDHDDTEHLVVVAQHWRQPQGCDTGVLEIEGHLQRQCRRIDPLRVLEDPTSA